MSQVQEHRFVSKPNRLVNRRTPDILLMRMLFSKHMTSGPAELILFEAYIFSLCQKFRNENTHTNIMDNNDDVWRCTACGQFNLLEDNHYFQCTLTNQEGQETCGGRCKLLGLGLGLVVGVDRGSRRLMMPRKEKTCTAIHMVLSERFLDKRNTFLGILPVYFMIIHFGKVGFCVLKVSDECLQKV